MRELRFDIGTGCTLRCRHCTRWRAAPRWAPPDAVRRGLAAVPSHADVIFAGGEPTLHPDLPMLLRDARRLGVARMTLATTAATGSRLQTAIAAGGDRLAAHVRLPSLDSAVAALLDGTSDGLARTCQGIDRLVGAGVPVTLVLRLSRAALPGLAELVDGVALRWPAVRAFRLSWPEDGADPRAVEKALHRAMERAAAHGIALRFSPHEPVAPCLFVDAAPLAGLFGPPRPDAPEPTGPCGGCLVRASCDGWTERQRHLAHDGAPRPFVDTGDALLALPRRQARGDAAPAASVLIHREGATGATRPEQVVLRVTARCNQRCPFCWVPPGDADPPFEVVAAACDEATALHPRSIALSGGEPGLRRDLPELVARLRARSDARLTLQTNATTLARRSHDAPVAPGGPAPSTAARLRAAGLDEVFVSLHAHEPERYAELTGGSARLLQRAVEGIDAALAAGLDVVVNHVVSRRNADALPEFAAFLSARFANRAVWNLSLVQAMGHAAQADAVTAIVPRLSELRGPLATALRDALALGLPVTGLDALCGLPLCALPDDIRDRVVPTNAARTDLAAHVGFEKGPPCAGCRVAARCPGLRADTARAHGFVDLRPVR